MNKIYNYSENYESPAIRGHDEPRPWSLIEEIRKFSTIDKNLLDIGCGTAFKIIPLASSIEYIIGLEPNLRMRAKALQNIRDNKINNIHIAGGLAQHLPFDNNSFDLVTVVLLNKYDIGEIYRVLKPNGHAIIETIGERDKHDIKLEFGSDEYGLRGQLSDLVENTVAEQNKTEFEALFSEVSVTNGFWKTYYSLEQLIQLLSQTPTIRNFDINKDLSIVDSVYKKFSMKQGMVATQHRVLIVAKKAALFPK